MDWDKLVQLLVNGVTLGSVYALVALGFSMVYGILKLLNLAHGDVLMVGAFMGWGVLGWLGGAQDPNVAVWLLIVLMILAAMAGGGFLGGAIERFAYPPLRRAPRIAPLISALGVSFFIQNSVLLLFGADFRSYESFDLVDVGVGISWGPLNVWVIRLVLIGSALAGAAGVLVGLVFFQVNHFMGFNYGLKGFTAAVVGGIGSIPGAMFGGIFIGLAEAISIGYIEDFTRGRLGSAFSDLVVFGILVLFMLLRPQGIFGKPELKKV